MKHLVPILVVLVLFGCSKEYCSKYTGNWYFEVTTESSALMVGQDTTITYENGTIECGKDKDEVIVKWPSKTIYFQVDDEGNILTEMYNGNFSNANRLVVNWSEGSPAAYYSYHLEAIKNQ